MVATQIFLPYEAIRFTDARASDCLQDCGVVAFLAVIGGGLGISGTHWF